MERRAVRVVSLLPTEVRRWVITAFHHNWHVMPFWDTQRINIYLRVKHKNVQRGPTWDGLRIFDDGSLRRFESQEVKKLFPDSPSPRHHFTHAL